MESPLQVMGQLEGGDKQVDVKCNM